jgi:DNA-binding beta-propeller fold protein YncE
MTLPLAVAADPTKKFAVAGLESSSPTVAIVDDTSGTPAPGASFTIDHPTNGAATANRTVAVALDQDTGSISKLAALTEFSNGDTVFTVLTVTPPPGGAFTVDAQVNLGAGTYDSVALYNDAAEALVTDSGGNRVIQLGGAGFAAQNAIPVGVTPKGVAVSEARQLGFVCNQASHTVSIIDLGTHGVAGTMTTSQGVGLGPTDIAINPSPFTGLISNTGDSTVTLFNVDDILTELGIP